MDQDQNKNRDKELIVTLALSLLFMWSGFFLTYKPDPLNLAVNFENKKSEAQEILEARSQAERKFFGDLNLEARAYIVYDPTTEEIISSHNDRQVLPLASLTKVMTILTASEQLNPKAKIVVKQPSNQNYGNLRQDEIWQMANLAALTLVSSSNEGATALAEAATSSESLVLAMNQKVEELGLKPLHFNNPTGLDEGPIPGGQGSALAMAKLFTYILKYKPNLLSVTKEQSITEKSVDGFNHTVLNTNTIINELPGLIASKTGYTDLAGGNLAIASNIGLNRPLIFVVLGSSKDGRFSDTKKLTSAAINYYAHLNK